jgi:hypothetical protein
MTLTTGNASAVGARERTKCIQSAQMGKYRRNRDDISNSIRRIVKEVLGCRFVEVWMRTAEARLAPVSEVSEMEMDMWRSMMEVGTSSTTSQFFVITMYA